MSRDRRRRADQALADAVDWQPNNAGSGRAVPIKSLRDFIRWLSIGAGLYLVDCLVATLEHEAPDAPWIARGVHPAYLFFGTCGWLLAPLIFAINERMDTQREARRPTRPGCPLLENLRLARNHPEIPAARAAC